MYLDHHHHRDISHSSLNELHLSTRLGLHARVKRQDYTCRESIRLIQKARKTKLLRCCNPKCGKPGYRKTLKLCGRCKLTRYCSRDCQKQHWSVGHKKCCGHDVFSDEQADPFQKIVMSMTKLALQNE
ncbi:uncharacterized protein LOC144877208 [Branchiostoma floridae x Branchiostoma japonicum]